MENIVEKLSIWKKRIETAKKEEAEASGRLSEMMNRLKTEFEVSSLEEGDALLAKFQKEIETLDGKIADMFFEIQSELEEIERHLG